MSKSQYKMNQESIHKSAVINRRTFMKTLGVTTLTGLLSGKNLYSEELPKTKPKNVIFVVLDTVRAKNTSLHGYHRNTTPNLLRLADSSRVFTNAISPASWTLPSHAAMFTGQHPYISGVHTWFDENKKENAYYVPPLPQSQVTLAEFFRDKGYATGGFVANKGYLGLYWQFNQGFDPYFLSHIPSVELVPRAIKWAESVISQPFFMFINIMDAHYPINCNEVPDLIGRPVNQDPELYVKFNDFVLSKNVDETAKFSEQILDQYDTGIANADQGVGLLLDWLATSELDENTMVVVTSDHGEFLGEHDLFGHSKDVYEEVVHVPLLVRGFDKKAHRIERRMSLVDLPREILLQTFGSSVVSEAPTFFLDEDLRVPVIAENYFARQWDLFDKPWSERFRRIRVAIYEDHMKLIWDSDGLHELYDLEKDPSETNNLINEFREVAERLKKKLLLHWDGNTRNNIPRVLSNPSEQENEQLKALGYFGDDTHPEANNPQKPGN